MPLIQRLAFPAVALALLIAAPLAHADDPPTFADRSDEDVRDADRKFGFLIDPLATAIGVFGGEADFVLERHSALAVEGAVYSRGGAAATAVGLGLLLYPQGSALHRFYLEPRAVYARPLSEGIAGIDWASDSLGLGMTAGWQWTWDYGFSMRLGGGALYFVGGSGGGALAAGPQGVLDGSLGWTF